MIFVNTSLDVALERNSKKRERSVPEYITRKSWEAIVQSNIGKFQNLFGMDNMVIIDNSKDDRELTTQIMDRCSKAVRRLLTIKLSHTQQKMDGHRKKIKKKKMKTFRKQLLIYQEEHTLWVFDNADTNNPKIKAKYKAQIDKQIEEFEREYGSCERLTIIGSVLTKRYRDDADLD